MRVAVSLGCCANNIHPLMGRVNVTFCFIMCVCIVIILHMSNYRFWLLLWESYTVDSIATDSLLCCRLHFHESLLYNNKSDRTRRADSVSVCHGFFATFCQSDATQNQLCALLFLNPDSVFALCFSFTGGLPTAGAMFVLYQLTTDPADHKSCGKRTERVG